MLSDNLQKYRTPSILALNTVPSIQLHKKYEPAKQKAVKIPKGIASKIVQNKKEFSALCIYFKLKPIYYSGVIQDWKKNIPELCDYLNVSINTLKSKIHYLVINDYAIFDANDLRLCSLKKLAIKYGTKGIKKHSIKNTNINLQLRSLALDENLQQQKYIAEKKLVKQELYEIEKENHLTRVIFEPLKSIADWNIEDNGGSKRHISRMKKSILKAYEKHPDLFDRKYMQRATFSGNRNVPQLRTTLSCRSLSKMYGCEPSPSTGYYWQTKLFENNLLIVTGHVQRITDEITINKIEQMRSFASNGYRIDEESANIIEGTYIRSNKKNQKKYAFKRLSNTLQTVSTSLYY